MRNSIPAPGTLDIHMEANNRLRLSLPLHTLLVIPVLLASTSCGLLGSKPVDIPPPMPPSTLAAGDRIEVRQRWTRLDARPLMVLVVSPEGTVDVPGVGTVEVLGYTREDLASVLATMDPELASAELHLQAELPLEASAPRKD